MNTKSTNLCNEVVSCESLCSLYEKTECAYYQNQTQKKERPWMVSEPQPSPCPHLKHQRADQILA